MKWREPINRDLWHFWKSTSKQLFSGSHSSIHTFIHVWFTTAIGLVESYTTISLKKVGKVVRKVGLCLWMKACNIYFPFFWKGYTLYMSTVIFNDWNTFLSQQFANERSNRAMFQKRIIYACGLPVPAFTFCVFQGPEPTFSLFFRVFFWWLVWSYSK